MLSINASLSASVVSSPCPARPFPPTCALRWVTSHRLAAGFPSPAQGYEEESLDLNEYLVRNQVSTFMFDVAGDSMIGAGIEEGDKVIVDRALTPKSRDIVVAVVEDEYTLKRLILAPGRAELHPENPAYKPRIFEDCDQLEIWGVVVGVVRRYS